MKLEKEVMMQNTYTTDLSLAIKFAKEFTDKETKLLKEMEFKKIKLTLEVEEPILDEEERKYLSGVIRPFRDRITNIIKKESLDFIGKEYIVIHCDEYETTMFPYFKKGTMYKGMELNKEYTLEELGL